MCIEGKCLNYDLCDVYDKHDKIVRHASQLVLCSTIFDAKEAIFLNCDLCDVYEIHDVLENGNFDSAQLPI